MPDAPKTHIWEDHPILLRILEDVPDEMKYPASQVRSGVAVDTPRVRRMLLRACTAVAKPDDAERWIRRDMFAFSEVSNDPAVLRAWYAETPDAEYWCNVADRQRWTGKSPDRIAAGWYCQACHGWDCAVQAYIDAEE